MKRIAQHVSRRQQIEALQARMAALEQAMQKGAITR